MLACCSLSVVVLVVVVVVAVVCVVVVVVVVALAEMMMVRWSCELQWFAYWVIAVGRWLGVAPSAVHV